MALMGHHRGRRDFPIRAQYAIKYSALNIVNTAVLMFRGRFATSRVRSFRIEYM